MLPPKCHHSSQYVGRNKVLDMGRIWARIKINVAQIWASSALYGLFMADIGPSFGLLVAQIWQTGADRPSALLHSMWVGARCWIWARSGSELKSMWPRFGPVLLYLVYSWLIHQILILDYPINIVCQVPLSRLWNATNLYLILCI